MALAQRNALGAFPDLQHAHSALDRLKAAGFPIDNISTIVQQIDLTFPANSNVLGDTIRLLDLFLGLNDRHFKTLLTSSKIFRKYTD